MATENKTASTTDNTNTYTMATAMTVELAVDMTCGHCSTDIKMQLKSNKNVKNVAVNLEKQTVLVETALPTHEVVKLIENTGAKALVTGIGAAGNQIVNLGSAVAIMHEGNPSSGIRGVTRIVQGTLDTCVIDGTLDGLLPNSEYELCIHEFGDISAGCNSCGEVLDNVSTLSDFDPKKYGDVGSICSNETGRSNFRFESRRVKVWDIIGRSMVVSSKIGSSSTTSVWSKLACGIIARSAGIFENVKRICACDGTTIWDEKAYQEGKLSSSSSQL